MENADLNREPDNRIYSAFAGRQLSRPSFQVNLDETHANLEYRKIPDNNAQIGTLNSPGTPITDECKQKMRKERSQEV